MVEHVIYVSNSSEMLMLVSKLNLRHEIAGENLIAQFCLFSYLIYVRCFANYFDKLLYTMIMEFVTLVFRSQHSSMAAMIC